MIPSGQIPNPETDRRRLTAFAAASIALIFCFIEPLYRLTQFAISSELYSYIILIPLISGYLIWLKRTPPQNSEVFDRRLSLSLIAAGFLAIALYWSANVKGVRLETEDSLALTSASFVLFFFGICAWFLGRQTLRAYLFPLGILVLLAPLPVSLRSWMESSLQHWSALAAVVMLKLAGTPVFYTNLTLELPDITLQVAPECSGIHSSVALFITSLLAGYLFLRSNWKRSVLALAVIPLGVLRNGFRVFTIGELCVHIGPEMIDSKIHHRGGPVFFALSLVPFLLLLYFLIRSERRSLSPNTIFHETRNSKSA